jgi:hypothetical protein
VIPATAGRPTHTPPQTHVLSIIMPRLVRKLPWKLLEAAALQ